jgi:hypothetical protein
LRHIWSLIRPPIYRALFTSTMASRPRGLIHAVQSPRSPRPCTCELPRAASLWARIAANSEVDFHRGQARLFASLDPIA